MPFIKILRQACNGRGPGKDNQDVCAHAIAQVLESIAQNSVSNDDENVDLQTALQASILTKVQDEIDEVHNKQGTESGSKPQGPANQVKTPEKEEQKPKENEKAKAKAKAAEVQAPMTSPPLPQKREKAQRYRPSSKFLQDVTLPDASPVQAGATAKKIWKVMNNGKGAWPRNSRLVCVGGDLLGTDPSGIIVPPVDPGLTVDLEVDIKVPVTPGRYVSYWRLLTDRQERFGHRLWIDIVVEKPASLAKKVENVIHEAVNGIQAKLNESTASNADVQDNENAKNKTLSTGPRKYEREIRVLQTMGFKESPALYQILEDNNGDIGQTVNTILG